MTATYLAAARAILKTSDSSTSNFPEYDFKTYESPTAFGSAHADIDAVKSGMDQVLAQAKKLLAIRFSNALSADQSDRSESTLTPSAELDNGRGSHTGEVARAKAIQRIAELRECAQEEQITVNDASQWDLLKFISGYTATDDLNIFLLDGGTFRVIWKTSDVRQVGFEFLGKGALKETVIVRNLDTGQYSASSQLRALQVSSVFWIL